MFIYLKCGMKKITEVAHSNIYSNFSIIFCTKIEREQNKSFITPCIILYIYILNFTCKLIRPLRTLYLYIVFHIVHVHPYFRSINFHLLLHHLTSISKMVQSYIIHHITILFYILIFSCLQ